MVAATCQSSATAQAEQGSGCWLHETHLNAVKPEQLYIKEDAAAPLCSWDFAANGALVQADSHSWAAPEVYDFAHWQEFISNRKMILNQKRHLLTPCPLHEYIFMGKKERTNPSR